MANDWPAAVALDDAQRRRILDAEMRFEIERQRLHRVYMTTLVREASPLLVDLADLWSLDMTAELRRIPVPASWPTRWRSHLRRQPDGFLSGVRSRNVEHLARRHRLGGGSHGRLRSESVNQAWMSISSCVLNMSVAFGSTLCFTADDVIQVWLHGTLPETVAIASVGRPLVEVVHHEAFALRDYPIRQVGAAIGPWSVIEAEAPRVAIPPHWFGRHQDSRIR